MRNKHHSKSMGPRVADLVASLHERDRRIFRLADIVQITERNDAAARDIAREMVNHGIATRLSSGLFALVPQELGHQTEYGANPYLLAGELVGHHEHFLSHASAMDIHQMLTQPQFGVYVTVKEQRIRSKRISGVDFRFVYCSATKWFGTIPWWLDKHDRIWVSDVERTVIDCLKQPQYCGGISEAAKGLWIRRTDISIEKLVDYALRIQNNAVVRRLGFLLELFSIGDATHVQKLQQATAPPYYVLDPTLPAEGKYMSRWKLRLNVQPEELQAIVRT